jgi:hypothetical protein
LLRRKRTGRVERDDEINLLGHQFCREFGQEIDLLFRGPKFEGKILSFYSGHISPVGQCRQTVK